MQQVLTAVKSKPSTRIQTAGAALGLFVLALIPRAISLQYFVTADEAKWVYRSAQFLGALLRGDFGGTAVNLTPAVTTTWLGSMGLAAYYWQHRAGIGLPFVEWLNTLPPFRAELPVLAATRWSMALFTSLGIVLIYLLARRLWGPWLALLGAGLVALDPHTLALSRIIGHDAPATMFVTLSLLALFIAVKTASSGPQPQSRWLVLSGAMGGLACLSKSPALFLAPFIGLVLLVKTWQEWKVFLIAFLVWCLSAYLVFFVFWPAVWIAPIRQPLAVVENAFLSAANVDEAAEEASEAETGWLVPDLGPFYYLVNGAFKLSPLVMVGLIVGLVFALKTSWRTWLDRDVFWLGLFALLFLVVMTVSGKRSNRYILPIFPPLAFLAAAAWLSLGWFERHLSLSSIVAGSFLLAGIMLIPYRPYFFNYFNPLLGGGLTASRLVAVGWGEGLDEAGRWLDAQPRPESGRAGSWYASSLAPYYQGDIADVTGRHLDYLVLYLKQIQSGRPTPEIAQYFLQQPPLHTVWLAGMEYARIYPGPAAQPAESALAAGAGWVAYRPHTDYAPIGHKLVVDLIGAEGVTPAASGPTVSLRWQGVMLARTDEGELPFERMPSVRRYHLTVPSELPPGEVDLYIDQHLLGALPAIRVAIPAYFTAAAVNFGDQVALVGFNPRMLVEDNSLTVDLAWRSNPKAWADYTVYVHLITPDGERLAGHDAPPNPPTGSWLKDQVVYDTHLIPMPDGLSSGETYHIRVGLYQAGDFEPLGDPYVLPVEVKVP